MTEDLKETLAELGPEYQAVVDRLRAPFSETGTPLVGDAPRRYVRWLPKTVGVLAAASLAGVLAFANRNSVSDRTFHAHAATYAVAYARDAAALEAIVASQRSDGSWESDFLTCQNAAALRGVDTADARVAYKKAVRYLRTKGLVPIDDAELRRRGEVAEKWMM